MAGNDANTLLLLNMDGVDDGTTFADTSVGGASHSPVAHGGFVTKTAVKKFGTASGYAHASSYLSVPDSTDFDSPKTVDFWMYYDTSVGISTSCVISHVNTSDSYKGWYINVSGQTGNLIVTTNNNTGVINTTVSLNTWVHVAVVDDGTDLNLYINGTLQGTWTGSFQATTGIDPLLIGALPGQPEYWYGYIDEVRISDTARWSANFIPPTEAYDTSSGIPDALTNMVKVSQINKRLKAESLMG